jgi:hypothetical protein
MELATNITNSLKIFGDSKFSNKSFDCLIQRVFNSFIFDENENLKIDFDTNDLGTLICFLLKKETNQFFLF